MSKSGEKSREKLIKILYGFLFLLVLANLLIIVTGKTYLYKGIQETYLKGKTGPTIYDSLVFPNRIAKHSSQPEKWQEKEELIQLSTEQLQLLNELQTTSFLVVKDNEIIVENYFENHTQNTKSNSFSIAKSFIGLMIGIAIDEQKIKSFDSPISDYLPFRLENDEQITIRDLLGMSSGLDWSESGSNPFSDNAEAYYTSELTKMMTEKSFSENPGEKFYYASGNSQLLGIILKNATGKYPTEYFEEKIWTKMEAENDFWWSLDKEEGIEKTFCCGYATTRDYAKMGQLILNKGKWNGEEIISEKILNEIISPYNEKQPFYGLHFWIIPHPEHPAIYYRGILGQYIVVVPSKNALFVRTGHQRKEVFLVSKEQEVTEEYKRENNYKEQHPLDVFDYLELFDSLVDNQ